MKVEVVSWALIARTPYGLCRPKATLKMMKKKKKKKKKLKRQSSGAV